MLPEGQQLSHYQLVRLLKSGGMGEVYLAVDTLLHRQVAIKVIHTDFMHDAEYGAAEEAMRLFLREAQAIAQLDQINILPLYDSGKEHINQALLMYMVMPYRYLGSLKDWLQAHQEQEPLPLAAVERIVTQAAFALQHAHDRQIVHQDVKPSNFLIHGDADHLSRLNLQLADFGVAKFMMKTSESQAIRGTPSYMAPEQWEGHPVPATDQYALAVMSFELLIGRPPFVGSGWHNLWHQHYNVMPSPPSTINPKLPKELDAVLLRAMAKRPEDRYSSVSAFAQAFTRAVVNSGNVYQTHVISVLEAQNGTNRVLILPNGKQVTLPIPPGAYNGQVIRLEGYGKPTTYTGTLGALILTIVVAEVDRGVSPVDVTVQHKFPTPVMQSEISPTLPAVSSRRGQVRGSAILKMCLALVLLLGMASLFYFSVSRAFNSPPPPNPTATFCAQQNYPSYLPGCGTIALYDPLNFNKDTSQGYDWIPQAPGVPPQNGNCQFQGGALYVSVDGDNNYPVRFHPCGPDNTDFSNFAYQIKMTFIEGDCGGVIFRGQGEKIYYFYICQDGEYGTVRYTRDPDNGMPDLNLNPPLRTRATRSSFIIAGSSQANIIAVLARGSKIDLYVNQHLIDSVEDNNYRDGTIGVLAKALDLYRPTEVAFSDARVWTF